MMKSRNEQQSTGWGFWTILLMMINLTVIVLSSSVLLRLSVLWSERTTNCPPCINGIDGRPGRNGTDGAPGVCECCVEGLPSTGLIGGASFIHTSPGEIVSVGTAFLVNQTLFNNLPLDIIQNSTLLGGTVFSLTAGMYEIHFETSLIGNNALALYKGTALGGMLVDSSTIAASQNASSWVHGMSLQYSLTPFLVMLGSYNGTVNMTTAGTASGLYIVRVTIIKLL